MREKNAEGYIGRLHQRISELCRLNRLNISRKYDVLCHGHGLELECPLFGLGDWVCCRVDVRQHMVLLLFCIDGEIPQGLEWNCRLPFVSRRQRGIVCVLSKLRRFYKSTVSFLKVRRSNAGPSAFLCGIVDRPPPTLHQRSLWARPFTSVAPRHH